MSLDALRKEIHLEAETERKKRIASAKTEGAAIIEKAKSEADGIFAQGVAKAEEEAKSLQSILSAARLEAKKTIAEARDKLVEAELEFARDYWMHFANDRRYPAFLKNLIEHGKKEIGSGAVVFVRKKDLALLKKWGVLAETTECQGGCIVATSDGRVRVNATLEAIFESKKETLRQKIFEKIA